MKPDEIVTDAEIEQVHGHANFGAMTKRQVVDEGVLKYAFGYSSGHTQMCILQEHGLLTKPKGFKGRARLTVKGVRYLNSVFRDVPLGAIMLLPEKVRARGSAARSAGTPESGDGRHGCHTCRARGATRLDG